MMVWCVLYAMTSTVNLFLSKTFFKGTQSCHKNKITSNVMMVFILTYKINSEIMSVFWNILEFQGHFINPILP